jgi:hypothetical protein
VGRFCWRRGSLCEADRHDGSGHIRSTGGFGGGIAIFVGELYMMRHHILGMSMIHGSGPTYKMVILIPIGWIIGAGAIFIRIIEKLAKPRKANP